MSSISSAKNRFDDANIVDGIGYTGHGATISHLTPTGRPIVFFSFEITLFLFE